MIARVMLAAAMTMCAVAATSPSSSASAGAHAHAPARMRVSPGVGCRVEAGHDYPSRWNATALLVCEARLTILQRTFID